MEYESQLFYCAGHECKHTWAEGRKLTAVEETEYKDVLAGRSAAHQKMAVRICKKYDSSERMTLRKSSVITPKPKNWDKELTPTPSRANKRTMSQVTPSSSPHDQRQKFSKPSPTTSEPSPKNTAKQLFSTPKAKPKVAPCPPKNREMASLLELRHWLKEAGAEGVEDDHDDEESERDWKKDFQSACATVGNLLRHNHIIPKVQGGGGGHHSVDEVLWNLSQKAVKEVRGMTTLTVGKTRPKTYVAVEMALERKKGEPSDRTYTRRAQWLLDMIEWLGEGDPKSVEQIHAKLLSKMDGKGTVRIKVPDHGTLMLQTDLGLSKNQMLKLRYDYIATQGEHTDTHALSQLNSKRGGG